MTRVARAWGELQPEQRLAGVAAVALLVTMFLPWYELQSLDRRTGAIDSHSISAFGDVSFVEAAVFLVAAGVLALLFARAERRDFHMPGSDGTVVMVAGGWATLLIFYRVFSRPDGHGYPVGIQWGFFLAFVASGVLTYAGWRLRDSAQPEAPLLRSRRRGAPNSHDPAEDVTVVAPSPRRHARAAPVRARGGAGDRGTESVRPATAAARATKPPTAPAAQAEAPPAPGASAAASTARRRPRYPPGPAQQLSFEDQPIEPERN